MALVPPTVVVTRMDIFHDTSNKAQPGNTVLPNQPCHYTHRQHCLCFQLGFSLARCFVRVCVNACVWNNHLWRLWWNSTQWVITELSVMCHARKASTINIYDALNQPHTEQCDSNHTHFFFLISTTRSILINISSAWWSHAVCWTSLVLPDKELAAKQSTADTKLNLIWNVCIQEPKWSKANVWENNGGHSERF